MATPPSPRAPSARPSRRRRRRKCRAPAFKNARHGLPGALRALRACAAAAAGGAAAGAVAGPEISYAATAPWLQRISQNAVQRFCRSRNLTFVILQLALEVAVFAEYSWEIFGACLELEFRWFYLLLPYGLLAVNTGFFFLSCITDPGVCNRCVHRFDHHCVWVNNCIGALNIRYFLPYLGTLTLMAACLALLIAAFLLQVVLLSGLMLGSYQEWATEINSIVQHLFLTFPRIVLLLGFLLLLSVLVGSYTCFMSYLLLTNQTTNEWFKRRAGCPECWLLLPHQQHSTFQNEYSKDFLGNIREVFRPNIYLKKKEM
uniref:Palmitoyltransferase n=1 Tax=Geotrypetes seraphini TaxID=260995 RepID=A0A6P8NMP6_GEOSA|nr:probable palmitoyltransferase ZDHHC4 isoform X3 [Geotrypetes seraphini]